MLRCTTLLAALFWVASPLLFAQSRTFSDGRILLKSASPGLDLSQATSQDSVWICAMLVAGPNATQVDSVRVWLGSTRGSSNLLNATVAYDHYGRQAVQFRRNGNAVNLELGDFPYHDSLFIRITPKTASGFLTDTLNTVNIAYRSN